MSLRQQLAEKQNKLAETKHTLGALPTETARKIQPLRDEISSIEQRRAEAKGRSSYVVRAPAAGRVAMLQVHKGQTVQPQRLQLEIVPESSPLRAELLIPTRAVGFVARRARSAAALRRVPLPEFRRLYRAHHGIVEYRRDQGRCHRPGRSRGTGLQSHRRPGSARCGRERPQGAAAGRNALAGQDHSRSAITGEMDPRSPAQQKAVIGAAGLSGFPGARPAAGHSADGSGRMRGRLPWHDRFLFRPSDRHRHAAAALSGFIKGRDAPSLIEIARHLKLALPAAAHRAGPSCEAAATRHPALGHEPFRRPEGGDKQGDRYPRSGPGRTPAVL